MNTGHRWSLSAILVALAAILSIQSASAIQRAPGAPAPRRSSSSIAITPDGSTLLVVNPDTNSLTLVDTTSASVLAELAVGLTPRAVAISPDGLVAYVANEGSDTVSIVDIEAQEVTSHITSGDRPVGVAAAPLGHVVAVAELGSDQLRLIDTRTLQTLSVIPAHDRPYGLSFTPDGKQLLTSHLLDGRVTVVSVRPFSIYLPLILRGAPTTSPGSHGGLDRAAGSGTLEIATWPNVAPAPGMVVNTSGTRAYLPQTMANGLGLNTAFDTSVFPKVSVLNLETEAHQTSDHISLPEIDQPVGLPWAAALTKADAELWVVNAASNDVSVIDISNPTRPTRRAHVVVGDNPRGITISPDGSTAYVNNTLAGTVSVIDTDLYTVTGVITVTEIPLPPMLLHGKRLFHSSARPDVARARWISCNTCHVEGEHDGRTWLLQYTGEVPPGASPVITRNTTSLLGMIETYPLRWSTEWDESADSEFSVRFEQFGSGLIDGEMHPTDDPARPNQGRSYDLDCLAAFIDSLAVPERTHALTAAERRGRAVFESRETACADCHPAPLYTDLKTHHVGTADADGEWFGPDIDTPTLRFLYDSAPYLHDGSAATLWDVLTTANPDDDHGVTSHLTAQELEDLVAFLLALPYAAD